ncbi:MAG TPA: lamin tail domain-containing protein, partial [Thermoguttaceae bacterium]|nr:lamin tail domain-containing protein [Thermoguttaceae bacterium]
MLRSLREKLLCTRRRRQPCKATSIRTARLIFESLESRVVLNAGPLLISEFMASNDSRLSDEDGAFPDWIEIYNPTGEAIDLADWSLTDDATDLQQWQFPSVTIESGGYQIVFASEKDRHDPLSELHTNFSLDRDGEYLALVRPDGTTIADAYGDANGALGYPPQVTDFSYGKTQTEAMLLPADAGWKYLVPTQADAQAAWTDPVFDDSAWQATNPPTPVLITEAGHGSPDYVEIQNVSAKTIVTDGWFVVLNKGTTNDTDQFHSTTWELPATMAPGEVLYKTDKDTENYFGENILWSNGGKGWAMIVDADGHAVDLAAWSYAESDMLSMNVEIDGST